MQDDDTIQSTEQSVEDRARAEAEARRQKILEGAGNRMDFVNGLTGPSTISPEVVSLGDEAGTKALTKSEKLAAMRRRRFKSKPVSSAKETSSIGDIDTTGVAEENVTSTPLETARGTTWDNSSTIAKERGSASPGVTSEGESQEKGVESIQKKYMGVARMRRKMIKEREAAEAKEGSQSSSGDVGMIPSKFVVKKNRRVGSVVPIVTHVVTVLLLFLAGLDVGLQQNRIAYNQPDLLVHTEIAPLRLLQAMSSGTISELFLTTSKISGKAAVHTGSNYYDVENEMENEFGEIPPSYEEEKKDNIDPLFQVDLDTYTQGPGWFMMAGRLAVAGHRANLAIFYYFPLSLLQRVQATFIALIQYPPMLFLLALAIRQAIGKLILGADLPEIVDDDKQRKDVIGMMTNMVKSFVQKLFPTAFSLYDAWLHLRSDMYIILCGLFVGIAWCHQFPSLTPGLHPFVDPMETVVETTPMSQVIDEEDSLGLSQADEL